MEEPKLAPSAQADRPWNLAQRVGFRLAFVFWALEIFPFPFDTIPKAGVLLKPIVDGYEKLALWTGTYLFGITDPISTAPNGSGDTTFGYVSLFTTLALSGIVALIWTVLDHRRPHYRSLHRFLRLALRYWLASAMLGYGLSKVLCMQMPYSLSRAIEPFGQASPMGLVWTFLGQSPGYEIFAGACETLAGVLLLFRRTTALGALVCAGVMANVFMMNMCYDVPVKIFSFELMLSGLFLALPSVGPLLNVLVLRRAVAADPPPPRSRRRVMVFGAVQLVFTAWFGYVTYQGATAGYGEYGPGAKQPSIAGIYDVKEITRNLKPAPLLATLPDSYARFAIDGWSCATLGADGRFVRWWPQIDEKAHSLKLQGRGDKVPGVLIWTTGKDGELTLVGTMHGALVTLRMKKADMSKEPLYSRGFHWVNEFPLNR